MDSDYPLFPLSDVLTPISRPESVNPHETYRILGAHWYAGGLYTKDTKIGAQIQADKVYRVVEGDFVYNRLFAWKGSFALATAENDRCYVSNEFPCFRVRNDRAVGEYLHWYFSREPAWDEAFGLSTGGTPTSRNRLKEDKLLAMRIPLPPLDEQRRIVARIEELAAKIAEAHGLRREALEEVRVLHGRAVAIAIENQAGVEHIGIEHLAEVRGGIQKGPHRTAGENPVRYLTVAHVHRNHISLDDPRYFEVNPAELERWRLLAGDVLIIEGNGSADQVGRTALFQGEIKDCVHQNHVIRIRPNPAAITAEYLNAYLNSPAGQSEMRERSRTTSGLHNLSVGRINEIVVPVPPLPEQQTIVAYLDSVQAKVDALTRLQAETAAELDALLPAVLDRAFRGEL